MKFYTFIALVAMLPTTAYAERLSGVNIQMTPFAGVGELSNKAKVQSHFGIKGSLDKLFDIGNKLFIGPRIEAGNSYLTTKDRQNGNRILSTYDNRFVTGGFKTGWWYGHEAHPSDVYLAAGFGRGYSKLEIDESGKDYYAQHRINQIEGNYHSVEFGTDWHVRRGFSFNLAFFGHLYNADQAKARDSVDSEVATPQGIQLTSGEKSEEIDAEVTQRTYGVSAGFTLGF